MVLFLLVHIATLSRRAATKKMTQRKPTVAETFSVFGGLCVFAFVYIVCVPHHCTKDRASGW